jgi:hypothetical protein
LQPRRPVTVDGPVYFKRSVFQCGKCRRSFAPLDRELRLAPREKFVRSVVRKIAHAGATNSFGGAVVALSEQAELTVSKAAVARVVKREGKRLDEAQHAREAQYNAPVDPGRAQSVAKPAELAAQRLVLEADATCVLTVKGEEHKSVYCATAFALDSRGKKGNRVFIAERRYAASAVSFEEFSARLKALAWRAGLRDASEVAFLADGALPLWKWAKENLPEGTVLIQDFWHVCEHLAGLGKLLFGEERYKMHFRRWKRALREGKVQALIRTLRRQRGRHRGEKRAAIEAKLTYLRAGCGRMDYPRYETQGWPIGSGAIEGTCKHLVKERFCVTGAHWRRGNLPEVLALRLSIFNDEWLGDWTDSPDLPIPANLCERTAA